MTVRKSASIDSLTASIQCASSMMNSAGCGAGQRRGVDQRGQPAPPRIRIDRGQRHVGVGDAQQIIEQQQILRVGIRDSFPDPGPRGRGRRGRPCRCPRAAAASPHGTGSSRACDSQKAHITSTPRPAASAAASRATRLLPMPGGPTTFTTPPRPPIVAVHYGVEGRHLPVPTDQARLGAPDQAIPRSDRHQPARAHRFVGTLDVHPLRFGQHTMCSTSRAVDSESITAPGGRSRFHPLGHPDLLADRGVAQTTPNRSHRRSPDPNSGPPAPAAPHRRGGAPRRQVGSPPPGSPTAARQARKA